MASGPGESGAGLIQLIDEETGAPIVKGRYKRQSQGREALVNDGREMYLTADERGASLETDHPEILKQLIDISHLCRKRLREEMQVEFTLTDGKLAIIDAIKVQRSTPAALRSAVELARDEVIPREEALLRIPARALTELLHPQVDTSGERDVIARGIAASPGGAVGRIAFTSAKVQEYYARQEPCILVRRETAPEDIRGMGSSVGVLTERGGQTSHAAVIARGMGVPCVVGASIRINRRDRTLTLEDGRLLKEGELITIDGIAPLWIGLRNLLTSACVPM